MWIDRRVVSSALLLCVVALGCNRGSQDEADPKNRLRDYISKSFAVKAPSDRAELSAYLTGDAKIRLTAWSDDQFISAFIDQKRKFVKLAVKEIETRSSSEVAITYELVFMQEKDGREVKITNKKRAQMSMKDGRWLIAEVQNLKELIEYQGEMSLP